MWGGIEIWGGEINGGNRHEINMGWGWDRDGINLGGDRHGLNIGGDRHGITMGGGWTWDNYGVGI